MTSSHICHVSSDLVECVASLVSDPRIARESRFYWSFQNENCIEYTLTINNNCLPALFKKKSYPTRNSSESAHIIICPVHYWHYQLLLSRPSRSSSIQLHIWCVTIRVADRWKMGYIFLSIYDQLARRLRVVHFPTSNTAVWIVTYYRCRCNFLIINKLLNWVLLNVYCNNACCTHNDDRWYC